MIGTYEQLLAVANDYLAATDSLNSNTMNMDQALIVHKAAMRRLRAACKGELVSDDDYILAKKEQAHQFTLRQQREAEELHRPIKYVARTMCSFGTEVGSALSDTDGRISVQMHDEYRPFFLEPIQDFNSTNPVTP